MLQHVRAARSGAMPRRAVSPSRDCARQRSSLLIVSPRHWISIWRGMGTLKGLALPMRSPARLTLWNRRRSASHLYMKASQAWKAQRLPAPGAPRLHAGKGAKRPNPLLAIRGPQCALEPPSEPHMCAECEDNPEGEIVLDTARGGAYYSILRQARKRLSESRGGHPRRREP